jgi:hypothetical protein
MANINEFQLKELNSIGVISVMPNVLLRVNSIHPTNGSWVFRYTVTGKVKQIGLGPYPLRDLAAIKAIAEAMRNCIKNGHNPKAVLDGMELNKSLTLEQRVCMLENQVLALMQKEYE